MTVLQIPLDDEELIALRAIARETGRSEAELLREAFRRIWLRSKVQDVPEQASRAANQGPVGLWDGEIRHSAIDHDTIYDDP